MIKVVILDFDDTLCLTEEACYYLENEVVKSMGFTQMSRKTHQKNWGMPLKEAITERIPGIDANEFMKQHESHIKEFVANGRLDTVTAENLVVLHELKKYGKKLTILTSRTLPEVKHLLHENHPLSKILDGFYHRDNLEYLKPDPRVFNQIFSDFDVEPQECVYVGDAASDAVAAKRAGMHFIAVLESGLRTKSDFAYNKVDLFVNKFTEILSYIIQH